jgi:hypothetical protein
MYWSMNLTTYRQAQQIICGGKGRGCKACPWTNYLVALLLHWVKKNWKFQRDRSEYLNEFNEAHDVYKCKPDVKGNFLSVRTHIRPFCEALSNSEKLPKVLIK